MLYDKAVSMGPGSLQFYAKVACHAKLTLIGWRIPAILYGKLMFHGFHLLVDSIELSISAVNTATLRARHLCNQHCHARSAFYAVRTILQGVPWCLTRSYSSHLGSAFKTDRLATTCQICITGTTGIDMLDNTVAIVTTEQVATRITIWAKRGQHQIPMRKHAGQWQQLL